MTYRRSRDAEFTATELVVTLVDGRKIATPLDWYPRLKSATPGQRANYEIMPMGIHWPDLDEDISVENLILGKPSSESQKSFKKWLEARAKAK